MILKRDICSVHLQAPFTMLHVDNKKPLTTHLHCKESPDIQKCRTTIKKIKTPNQQPKNCNLSKEI